jgi:type IV secretion system protein VirD4
MHCVLEAGGCRSFVAMNATKILRGQVLLVAAFVLGFVWAATEWTAWKLGFQSQLRHPWFSVLG